MKQKKISYKDIHGTTKVGDFLRKIGKSEILTKVLGVTGEILTGDFVGALGKAFSEDKEMSQESRAYAIELAKIDMAEHEAVSKRWQSDMASDSWLSKNVRPLVLLYLVFIVSLLCVLDSSIAGFEVKEHWVSLFVSVMLTTIAAYFGSRGAEKWRAMKTNNRG